MPIEWDEAKMGTGFHDIDAQHQDWIRKINEFDQAIVNGMGIDTIINGLAFLTQYTELHFSQEEDRMAACNCPALAENRKAHARFRRRLEDLFGWLQQEQPNSAEISIFKKELEDWVTNHICSVDIKLRGCQ